MTIEQMLKRKKELGYSYAQISDLSGVPVTTVQKVLGGFTKTPRFDTLQALEKVLKPNPEESKSNVGYAFPGNGGMVAESKSYYGPAKRPGEYTLKDYYALPEDQRVELIDGMFYDMTSPAGVHQLLAGAIFADLLAYVQREGGDCMPIISPFDVQLDKDDRTMVEPDVMIVCDRKKIKRRCVYGAPDFIVEILSPSTKKKDLTIKMKKYMDAGVREYWIIWPDTQKVAVYMLDGDMCPTIYGFDSCIPVGIWNGRHSVNMAAIYEHIRFIYDVPEEGK